MIKNIIFDFGGVLAQFNEDVIISPYTNDEALKKLIAEVVLDRVYWDPLDKGTISHEQIKESIKTRLPGDLIDLAYKVYDNWIFNLKPITGMTELVSDISKINVNLYILSDISRDFASEYHKIPWIKAMFSNFTGFCFSGVEGLVKPNPETFNNLITKFNLNPAECLFIDDRITNIEGAKACNISGYLFDGDVQKLRKYLNNILY